MATEPKTEGQRLLLAAGEHGAIVARTGAAKGLVTHWRTAAKRPAGPWRAVLREVYGIPVEAWDQLPGGAKPTRPAKAKPSKRTAEPGSIGELTEHIERLNAELDAGSDLTASNRVQLHNAYTRAVETRAKLLRDIEMLEDRVVREHPAYRRLTESILSALRPYPDAAAAVARALESDS